MLFSSPVHNDLLRYYYRNLLEPLGSYQPLGKIALLPINSDSFLPESPDDVSEVNIGVYLPENGQISTSCLNPPFKWDLVVVPSSWLEYQLKIRGITNVVTVLPGYTHDADVDSSARQRDGRFIVATGGGFSLHQGHDLLLAAMSRFMACHDNCWFACNWDLSRSAIEALRTSPHCHMNGCVPWDLSSLLENNGIATTRTTPARTISFAADALSDLVSSADVYLSPARVDIGVDPILAVFQAAEKRTITFTPLDGVPQLAPDGVTVWSEPVMPSIIERLESAYSSWMEKKPAEVSLKQRSWSAAAEELYNITKKCYEKHFISEKSQCSAFTYNKRGVALAGLGLYKAAEENYRWSLDQEPSNSETYNCIGNLMDMQERRQEALQYFDKAIALDKRFTAAFFNKATTLKGLQRLDDAIAAYQAALQTDPGFAMGWLNLAIAFALNNQEDKADSCFRKTVELDPENTDALFLWGNQLLGQQELEKAIECYDRVLALEPDHHLALNSQGIAYLTLIESEKAYDTLLKALLIKPDMTSAMTNIGTACRDMDRLDEAVSWYERALAIEPDNADTHWNYSLALLHQGKYLQGWQEYEWRFLKSSSIIINSRELPLWKNEDLRGKRILLQAEQGYGDTIQFMRYALAVSALGAHVIVECQDSSIQSVVKLLPGSVETATWNDRCPSADFKFPLMSLPFVYRTTVDSIPAPEGYVVPAAHAVAAWRSKIDVCTEPGKMRIGFVWDGRKTFRNDKRSIPLEKFAPLFALEGITFVSLQKGEQSRQLQDLAVRYKIIDVSEQLETFADTAALISGLDLVICVDTSVAHLAGAIGCPTWILLKVGPDWRWLEQRSDSPWYSSVRLFRQKSEGEWDDVVQQILFDLKIMSDQKNSKVTIRPSDNINNVSIGQ